MCKAADVIRELKAIGFTRFNQIASFSDDGLELRDSDELTAEENAAVRSVTYTTTETKYGTNVKKSVQLHDKTRALEQLGNHLALFKDFDTLVRGLQQYGEVVWTDDGAGFVFRYATEAN